VVMKKIAILVLASVGLLLAQSAYAVPPGDNSLQNSLHDVAFTFTMSGGSAQVDCEVYQFASASESYPDKYLYTYQITNNTSVGLSFFSIGVTTGAVINDWGRDAGVDTVEPLQWTPVIDGQTSQVQSMDALFGSPIKNTNTSALLWFVSDRGLVLGDGFLFGTLARVPQYDSEELFAPVPEPATISLLAIGGILAARARRKNNV